MAALAMTYWDHAHKDPRSLDARDFDADLDWQMPDETDPDELLIQEALALFDEYMHRRQQRHVPDDDIAGRFYAIQVLYGGPPRQLTWEIDVTTLEMTASSVQWR